jgi:hypothetical protein
VTFCQHAGAAQLNGMTSWVMLGAGVREMSYMFTEVGTGWRNRQPQDPARADVPGFVGGSVLVGGSAARDAVGLSQNGSIRRNPWSGVAPVIAAGTAVIAVAVVVLVLAGLGGESVLAADPVTSTANAATAGAAGGETRTPPEIDPKHPLAPALEHAYAARKALTQVKDYEAKFFKRERIGGRLISAEMGIRFRTKPFSVYLRYVAPNAGREVLYVDGMNNGKLLAREASGLASLVGTVSVLPTSSDAMAENRHPITLIGIEHLLERVIAQWEVESQYGEIDVKYRPSKLGGADCKVLESSHPRPRRQFKFHMTRLWIDEKQGLPVRVEQFDFPAAGESEPQLVEEYTYTNLKLNIGLGDRDFDPRNPNYSFK